MPHHKQLRSTLRALAQRALLNPYETRHYPVSALERSQRRGGAGRLPATAIGRSLSRGGPVLAFARLVDLVCALACPLPARRPARR